MPTRSTIDRGTASDHPVTQQYIIGEFSALLGGFEPAAVESFSDTIRNLRREVEVSPLAQLPQLARKALNLTDRVCSLALDEGDVRSFSQCAKGASALREFAVSAKLLS
jgi:hypothetical protein